MPSWEVSSPSSHARRNPSDAASIPTIQTGSMSGLRRAL
jgi:hypothetical protein